jgi:RNA polymerase primary sigma factor
MTDIPSRLIEAVNRLVRARRALFTETSREPTPEELAERLALPIDKVRKLVEIAMTPIRG